MKRKMLAIVAFLCVLIHGQSKLTYAQSVTPLWSWGMSSDFGPRLNLNYDFHQGIDYNAAYQNQDLGTPITAIENGRITAIANRDTFYNIDVLGDTTGSTWLYGHIFSTSTPTINELGSNKVWELKSDAILSLPTDTANTVSGKIVILWSDATRSRAEKVLSIYDHRGRRIKTGTNPDVFILGINGNLITTSGSVTRGDSIAPMGNAATNNVHLHLGLNYPDDNPLVHLIHTPNALPSVTIGSPENNHIFKGAELHSDFPIRVDIDSTGGPDLDKVELWVYPNNDAGQARPLGNTIPGPAFLYGGRVGEGFTPSTQAPGSNGGTDGVMPYEVNGNSLGHDLFVLNQVFAMPGGATLPNGEHSLVVRATDVNGNSAPNVVHRFVIQQPELIFGYVDPPSGDANTDFYYYVYYDNPAGDSPATANVYIDGAPHAMTLYGGTATAGSYVYGPVRLGTMNNHDYFFHFTDGLGGLALLPAAGRSSGPTVTSYTLTVSCDTVAGGEVSSPGITYMCGHPALYAPGTSVTLNAEANVGYIFAGWSGCDSANDTSCSITMNSSKNITAAFTSLEGFELPWANAYGDGNYEETFSVQRTAGGGYITGGYVYTAATGYDALAMKLDGGGNLLWKKKYGGSYSELIRTIQQTSTGEFIAAGYSNSFSASGYDDAWVLKLDSLGNVIWQKTYGDAAKSEQFSSIQQTPDGGYVAIGTVDPNATGSGSDAIWVVKLDSSGNIQWQKTFGGAYMDWASSIELTSDGGYLAAGATNSFGPGAAAGYSAIWLLKLDSNGIIQWQKAYGDSSSYAWSGSARQDADGGYSVAGTMNGDYAAYSNYNSAWILKLDSSGTVSWQKKYGGGGDGDDVANSIRQTSDGSYVVTGYTTSFGLGGYDAWVFKLDASGNVNWQKTFGGVSDDWANTLELTSSGGIVVGGLSYSYSSGGSSAWTLKMDSNGDLAGNCGLIGTSNAVVTNTNATAISTSVAVTNTNVVPVLSSAETTTPAMVATGQCVLSVSNIGVSPASLNFGSVDRGDSATRTVTIRNGGTIALTVNSLSITGQNAAAFSQTNSCSMINPGSECLITVTYSPTAFGPNDAALVISSNDPDTPTVNVSLNGSSGNNLTVVTSGTGSGAITSNPSGINCGTNCVAVFQQGAEVTLTAMSDANSIFVGWTGTACSGIHDCIVTLNSAPSVTVSANFEIKTYTVTPSLGSNGLISPSTPQIVSHGSVTTFTITPTTGYHLAAVTGCGGTLSGNIYTTGAITIDCTVSATFTINTYTLTKIGVFMNGNWYLDANQSWDWNGTPPDILGTFGIGQTGAIPVVGDWNGDGKTEIGIYVNGEWYLDMNNNWQWDGEGIDVHGVFGAGLPNAIPVVGDWNGDGISEIGIYSEGNWYLDKNRNWAWDGEPTDTFGVFGIGLLNPVPVTGDWNGDGTTEIGIYSNGNWYLDKNRSWAWEGEPVDTFGIFGLGLANPIPVTGDWNGNGITKIGIYSEGNWYLDVNASWQWDGTPTDTFGIFGMGLGTVMPVTGNW